MTLVDSRVRKGELTFGADTTFACQATNVHVTPSYDDDGDQVETLCGDVVPPGKKESWVIAGTSVQDFDDPQGFLTYCFENRTTTQAFTWQPNVEGAPEWSGDCVIVALEEGGDVNTRNTTDWEFDVSGTPTRAYGSGTPATGATAGTPGSFTPSGATVPADLAALSTVTASPTTAWTTGQYVVTADSVHAHWDGAAWATGDAP